jgi:hypothetical protein
MVKSSLRLPALAILTSLLVLGGCSTEKKEVLPDVSVTGARDAIVGVANFVGTRTISYRPAALVGIYTSMYYADGSYLPVLSARTGVMAQMQLHAKPSEESMENTYALLEEFGTILQIDIPDLLDRSTDRAFTLTEYQQGLANITTRAERRQGEVTEYIATLRTLQRDVKNKLNDENRAARKALDAGDFTAASEHQQAVAEFQLEVSKNDASQKQFTELKRYFDKLVPIAHARQKAIDENRELLIAGLKAVDVPGAQGVGAIEPGETNTRRRTTEETPFGTL